MCQKPRQPIVMKNDPAKNPKIDKDSYTYAIKYGSDPEHQNYYICPKVWCPYCEIPLAFKKVKNITKELKLVLEYVIEEHVHMEITRY